VKVANNKLSTTMNTYLEDIERMIEQYENPEEWEYKLLGVSIYKKIKVNEIEEGFQEK
jgi:hypothetical protein